MKFLRTILIGNVLSLCLFSCSFVPVNNQYEKAGTLKKGNLELNGNFTGNRVTVHGDAAGVNNNVGFRVGYGISDKFDLKLRYERLMPVKGIDDEFKGASYYSIVPKFSMVPGKLALLVPLSHYTYKENLDGTETKEILNSIAPQFLYTLTGVKKKTDLTFGLKADFLFGGDGEGDGGGAVIPGLTIGAGFSNNLDKWAVRPELGASFLGGGAFLNYGIGLQFIISGKNK